MVIELSGVQLGLKSCAQVRFEITSMISYQNCTTRSSLYYIHFEITKLNCINTRTTRFWSVPLYIE